MDLNSTLCLACSSSLPPRLIAQLSASPSVRTGSKPVSSTELFLTRCCARPICPDCISRNPRLARYDPCLFCLGGVSAAGHSALQTLRNVDGGVKDSDVFALGDEEEDNDEEGEGRLRGEPGRTTPPPAYSMEPSLEAVPDPNVLHGSHTESQPIANRTDAGAAAPAKYYLKGGDTLTGISLRFGVDGRTLCRLNNLPPSTLTTTPHLLHTRAFVTLPPSSKIASLPPSPPPDPIEEERRARERAQKRLQLVTKEVDWRVARAYVSIAEDSAELSAAGTIGKGEKKAQSRGNEPLESRAVEQYMDDEEWEVAERRAGRTVHIPRFPLNTGQEEGSSKASGPSWWQRS